MIDANGSYKGYCVDLMNRIAKILNFTYEIRIPSDNMYGTLNNGSWNGLMKELLDSVSENHELYLINIINIFCLFYNAV